MAPDAKTDTLLYVSDSALAQVDVLSYPKGKKVGRLSGFTYPAGECVDPAGNVWIVDSKAAKIIEYAHDGASPIAVLSDAGMTPTSCAVDSLTGDLAVTNAQDNLAVYASAKGDPTIYRGYYMRGLSSCIYDDEGNLFADAWSYGSIILELPKGGSSVEDLKIPKPLTNPWTLLWDGSSLAVVEAIGGQRPLRLDRFTASGSQINVTSTTQFTIPGNRWQQIGQFALFESSLMDPVLYRGRRKNSVLFWPYPKGKTSVDKISFPLYSSLVGLAVSRAN